MTIPGVLQTDFKHTAELGVSKDYVLHLAPNSNFSKVAAGSASSQAGIFLCIWNPNSNPNIV